jgi:hypothetical protein
MFAQLVNIAVSAAVVIGGVVGSTPHTPEPPHSTDHTRIAVEASLSGLLAAQRIMVSSVRSREAAVAAQPVAGYVENVWAAGFQTQVDACRGGVDLTAAYGVPTIGERWGCGGSRFPTAGTIVRLTGIRAGLYRVGPVVAVLDAYRDSPADIPRGYALLYQTCRNDDAHAETFTALTPVN